MNQNLYYSVTFFTSTRGNISLGHPVCELKAVPQEARPTA
jgi:hypothetical protein